MRKFVIILLSVFLSSANLYAQGVDLPEFVIKGVKKVSLPKIEKTKPEFVKPLSESYFKHKFKPEDFDVTFIAKKDTIITHPFNRKTGYSGRIKAAAGMNAMPAGEAFVSYANDNFLVTLSGSGRAIKDYEPYSDKITGGGGFSAKYFLENSPSDETFSLFGVDGYGKYYDGKFWMSDNPQIQRKSVFYNGKAKFERFSSDKYKIALNLSGREVRLLKENFTENCFGGSGMFEYRISPFLVKANANFLIQTLIEPIYEKQNYYSANAEAEFKIGENAYVNFGGSFATLESENFFYPSLGIRYELGKYFMLSAQIDGKANLKTNYDYAFANPYYDADDFVNVFRRESNRVTLAARFNYYDFIFMKLEAFYSVTDGFSYFDDSARRGIFRVRTLDDVTNTALLFNADLLYSRFGYFSVKTKFQNTRLPDGNVAPYSPGIYATANYNFIIGNRFSVTLGAEYFSHFYADIANARRIEPFANLFVGADYKVSSNLKITLDVNNILNRNNYYFPEYKTVPFDVLVGIEYFWK